MARKKVINTRYGVSDIVCDSNIELPKYATIYDVNGHYVTEVEIYNIEEEE